MVIGSIERPKLSSVKMTGQMRLRKELTLSNRPGGSEMVRLDPQWCYVQKGQKRSPLFLQLDDACPKCARKSAHRN